MPVGAHVRTAGTLVDALDRGRAIGADVVQVFTQSPRRWRQSPLTPDDLARYRRAQADDPVVNATFCHASYLVNLASPDPALLGRSRTTLAANLTAAMGMGASGLVVHVGSHLGRGFDAVAAQVSDGLLVALDAALDQVGGASGGASGGAFGDGHGGVACPLLIENTAGAGGSLGASFEELATLLDRAGAGDALGICLDTQHLWASGVSFGSPVEADDVVAALDATVGLRALRCLHLNDSKSPFGSRVDRHENLGEGTIGEKALACLVGHPAFEGLPAILEVAGAGAGPRAEDVAGARRILRSGRRLWQEVWGARDRPGAAAEWGGQAEKEER